MGKRFVPRLMAISDRRQRKGSWEAWALALSKGGVPWVQLREKDLDEAALREAALRLRGALPLSVVLSVNGWHPSLSQALGVGLHLGEAAKRLDDEAGLLIGRSVHDRDGLRRAEAEGVDYVLLSPVYEPRCKPGVVGMGLDALAAIAATAAVPVLALGGITTPAQVRDCLAAGAHGVAVMGALQGQDARATARALVDALCL